MMPTRMEKRRERQKQKNRVLRRFAAELHSGQFVAVEKLSCRIHGVQRGQIVICRYPGSYEYYIKRVVALGGDTLEIRDGVTYLNGQALQEDYVTHPAQEDFSLITVEPGHVFVMGDNRANSHDSRAEGALEESDIVGRAVCVLFPFDQIKTLNAPQE